MQLTLNDKLFSKAIKKKRVNELDISLRLAAEQVGVHFTVLHRVEKGSLPELLAYAKICKWLELPMETFIK